MNANTDLPRPAIAERVYLDDVALERGWSKRKLDYLAGGRKGKGRLVYWQDSPRGRRYTTRTELESFDRGGIKVSTVSLANSNAGRLTRLETAVEKLNREIREIRERWTPLITDTDRRAA